MTVSARLRRRWRSPCQSNSSSITTHFGGRTMPSSAGRKSPARALAYGSISRAWPSNRWPFAGLERPVGLEVIELAGPDAGHEDAPDVAPAIRSRDRSSMISAGSRIGDVVVEQHPHRRGASG